MFRTLLAIGFGVVLGAVGIASAGLSDSDSKPTDSKTEAPKPLKARLNHAEASPEAREAAAAFDAKLAESDLEISLVELVKTRVSQMNACAMCLNAHSQKAREEGVSEQRVALLNAWRDAPFYTDRERAALAWTEAVTNIQDGVSDEVYDEARRHFSEKELVDLTWMIGSINAWNRVNRAFKTVPKAAE